MEFPTPKNWLPAEDRRELGRAARKAVPRSSHGDWSPPADRPDPVVLLEEQNVDRLPWLVPVRRGRMVVSPFTFYRGAARIMAADLAATPNSGLIVQACGDAHLSNFGAYASPERQLVVDANDFDETLPGPWEWDLKRLATSFMIAAQNSSLENDAARKVTAQAIEAYRTAMDEFAAMRSIDIWYDHLSTEELRSVPEFSDQRNRKLLERFEAKARSKDSLQALAKLAIEVDGKYRIRHDPPVLLSLRDLGEDRDLGVQTDDLEAIVLSAFESYKDSLEDARRVLVDRYKPVDIGLKVVGVGSVGTRCLILLLEGRDREDPLFLQVKEAGPSVLEEFLEPTTYENQGQRVVEGQRLMQAVSDIFLGWTRGNKRDFYIRQLRDWKGSVEVENRTAGEIARFAQLAGWILARGHARSGDAIAISSYLGKGRTFADAVTNFADAYARQNQKDFERFEAAIADGELESAPG